jgi:hypothetical protein
MQDVFNKIANASATKGGNNLKDGKYRLVVEKMLLNTGHTGTSFIPELRVMKAEQTEKDAEPNAAGSTVSCVWNVTKHASAPGNVKAFLLAVLGLDEATTPAAQVQELLSKAVGAEQILRGFEIDASTIRRVNQGRDNPANRGQTMTLPVWQHVPGQTQESVARNRAMLAGTAQPAAAAPAQPATQAAPAQAAAPATPAGGVLSGILGR